MTTINLNDLVRVRLTPAGKATLAKSSCKKQPLPDGSVEVPLWELMLVFGQEFRKGSYTVGNQMFIDNEILVVAAKASSRASAGDVDAEEA